MSVDEILLHHGLEQYSELFEQNHVDLSLAKTLTEADLKELGIQSFGHRRKILAAFKDEPQTEALVERRDVVIIFVDLVEFTSIIRATDPEDAYKLIRSFLNLVDDAVRDCGGTVERHLGDAVMAVFGAPLARGDEAMRAVSFASRIHECVSKLGAQKGIDLRIRVGVAYGHVIVRSAPGEEISVVGPSVNLAARLSSVARAGETLISSHVNKACGKSIVVGPARLHELKGFDGPIESRELLGFSPTYQAQFVGRAKEIDFFVSLLKASKQAGTGQLVILRGEAGIGKTSILNRWLGYGDEAGFAAHVSQIQDFGVAQTRTVRAAIVRDLLSRTEIEAKHKLWLAPPSKAQAGERVATVLDAATPEVQLRNRRKAFEALLRAATKRAPLILAFEDAHWADSDILELMAECCRMAAHLPIVVIATTRTEGRKLDDEWLVGISPTSATTLNLGPLTESECKTFANAMVGDATDIEEVIARSSGHPLYLEQLLRHGQEDAASSLPHSIHTIIQARIDLLELSDRRAARAAAVLGQHIEVKAIQHLLGDDSYDPAALIERRILKQTQTGYSFHHALIRDCLYETVMREDRERFHRCAAEWYSEKSPGLCADHLAAIDAPEAADAYLLAARQASSDRQHSEAARLAGAGVDHATDPDLIFHLILVQAESCLQLNKPDDAIAHYRKARDVCVSDPSLTLASMIGEVTALRLVDRVSEAWACIEQAEHAAKTHGCNQELSHLKYLRGSLLFPTGEFQASLAAHDEALQLARKVDNPERIADALSGRGDALYAQGRMSSAREVFDNCLAICAEHGLVRIKAQNLFMRGTVRIYALDWNGALEDALASAELAKSIGNARAEVVSRLTASWVYAWTGQLHSAKIQAEDGLAVAAEAGAVRFKPFLTEALGHALLLSGERSKATACLDQAVKDMRDVKAERFIGPWVLGSYALCLEAGKRQRALMSEAEELLSSGAIGHNHFQYRRLAIDVAIRANDPDGARRQADKLEAFTQTDPTPWSTREIERARRFSETGEPAAGASTAT